MAIIIVDLVLLVIFMACGIKADAVGTAFLCWVFLSTIATLVLADGEYKANTPQGREQWRHEKERDEKEWLEWRYNGWDKEDKR